MRKLSKYVKAGLLLAVCMLFLGMGMKAEAAPAKVTGLKQVDAGSASVDVKWETVFGNGVQYKAQICADNRFASGVNVEETYSHTEAWFTGLSSGKKYYVRVMAYDDTSQGQWSDPIEVVTEPGKNSNAKFCQSDAKATSITLKWNRNTEANAYRIEYFKSGQYNSTQYIDLGNVTTYTFSKLGKDTEYSFYLYPMNVSATYKAVSNVWDGSATYCPTLPGKVNGLKGSFWSPDSDYFELSWNKRDCADGYQYEIWSMTGKKGKRLVSGKKTYNSNSDYFTNNKLKKPQFLKLRVRPYVELSSGSTKYGAWSNWAYTSRQPSLGITNIKGGQKLTWKKVSGAKSYTIAVSTQEKTGYKKVKTVSGNSLTVKKCGKSALKSGKTYYYTIVANKKIGKKTYQGSKTHYFYRTYY